MSAELRPARKRVRERASEMAFIRHAAKFLDQDKPHPQGFNRRSRLADTETPVRKSCQVLGVPRQGYYRRQWLPGFIREVQIASRGTCGYRRIRAVLAMAIGVTVIARSVSVLMTAAYIHGLPGADTREEAAWRCDC